MYSDSLDDWLARLERLDPHRIELGLERVGRVARTMGVERLPCTVVTVAGTNGKGSTVALLEAIYTAAGYRVGAYTSPHLVCYNERVRIAGRDVPDGALCEAFERVEAARGATELTYFEFGTLAALDLFARAGLDIALLEVGLGGRLDAVNVVDSDIAVITAVAVDHAAWLGRDREEIGAEKAGVLRCGRPAVCSDPAPPRSLLETAARLSCDLSLPGRDFFADTAAAGTTGAWNWEGGGRRYRDLPAPGLPGGHQYQNAAGALMVVERLRSGLPVSETALRRATSGVRLPGRCQLIPGHIPCVLDVAHNKESAERLAEYLEGTRVTGRTRAVVAVLEDKDVEAMVAALAGVVDDWYIAAPATRRAAPAERVRAAVVAQGAEDCAITVRAEVVAAYHAARSGAQAGDRVVVFGSFYTVGDTLRVLQRSAA